MPTGGLTGWLGRGIQAARLLERLSAAEPGRRDLLAELAITRRNEAAVLQGAAQRARMDRAAEALQALRALGPLSPDAERLWARVTRAPEADED